MKIETKERFIEKANLVHNNKFDYSLVEYQSSKTKIKIICPLHDIFEQVTSEHLRGSGCKKCSSDVKRLTLDNFIKKAKEKHNNKFDYSLVEYKNVKTKIKIKCNDCETIFEQKPSNHLQGGGCKKCGYKEIANKNKSSQEYFINKANEIHGNLYDYSLVEYISSRKKIIIKCKNCSTIFTQEANAHLRGQGCKKCNFEISTNNQRKKLEDFNKQAKEAHGDLYDYSSMEYKNIYTNIKIKCKKCDNFFYQTPKSHLRGNGCPFPTCCKGPISKSEVQYLDYMGIPQENRHKTIKINEKNRYVDALVLNTVYEFFGDFWHGNPEKHDPNKINPYNKKTFGQLYKETFERIDELKKNGYEVVYIWESDFKKLLKGTK